MIDIVIEVMRAVFVGGILIALTKRKHIENFHKTKGWIYINIGFALIFFGTLIDITDNFEYLNKFVVIGNTEVQSILEKVAGYLLGYLFLAVGFFKWLPKIIENATLKRNELNVQKERLKVLHSTVHTVHHIVNNFLNNMQLFVMEIEDTHGLNPESLELMKSLIAETSSKINKLARVS